MPEELKKCSLCGDRILEIGHCYNPHCVKPLKPCREIIADTIKPYLYIPMFMEDDEEYIKNRSLEIADEIIKAWEGR